MLLEDSLSVLCNQGQSSCHHMWSLLDANQEIPWTDEPLVLHHKYRCTEDAINTRAICTEITVNLH